MGGFPGRGETRVRIDSCGLFTFYDPALADQEHARVGYERRLYNLTANGHWPDPLGEAERQATLKKLMRRQRTHRLMNISATDGEYMRVAVENRMRAALAPTAGACSGINWLLTTQEIAAVYGYPLYDLATMASANVRLMEGNDLRSHISHIREVAHSLWMPLFEYPRFTKGNLEIAFSVSAPESQEALERCKMQYKPFGLDELSPSEQTTHIAVSDILTAVCDTLLPVYLSIERLWLANFNNASAPALLPGSSAHTDADQVLRQSHPAIEELMTWLGWADQWTACSPGCGMGEICYIPIWPVMGMGHLCRPKNTTGYDYPPERRGGMDALDGYLWEPACVDARHSPPK